MFLFTSDTVIISSVSSSFTHVVQGVLLSVPEAMEDMISMKRLWVHEVLRVFYDRLVDGNDQNWLFGQLRMVIEEKLEEDMDEMFLHLRTDEGMVSLI